MRRLLLILVVLGVAAAALGLYLTRPRLDGPDMLAGLTGDAAAGELVFTAAGCASCHMAEGASGEERLVLTGGQTFASPFGSFTAPNISMDPELGTERPQMHRTRVVLPAPLGPSRARRSPRRNSRPA